MDSKRQELIVPAGIYVESFVDDYKRKDKRNGLIDAMHYILHYMNKYQYVHAKEFMEYGDIPITVDQLRIIAGKNNADGALEILLAQNVIVKTRNYSKQLQQSSRYRFHETVVTRNTRKVTFRGASLKSYFQKLEGLEENAMLEADQKIQHLTKFLKSDKLSFDWAAANYWIHEYNRQFNMQLPVIVQHYAKKDRDSKTKKLQIANNLKLLNAFANAQKLADGKITYGLSKTNNRLSSNIVLLPKSLRNFIKYNGEHLVEIDINASQPHVLHLLLSNATEVSKGTTIFNILHSTSISSNAIHTSSTPLIPVTLKGSEELDNELAVFSSLFNSGDFYINIGNYINEKNGETNMLFTNRKSTKSQIMYLLFESFYQKQYQKVFLAFKKAFPAMTDAMELLKPAVQKNKLAILLQSIESYIVLETITKVIAEEVPNAPLFTIHDAILTTPSYKDQVTAVFKRELNNVFQHNVKIKVKEFTGSDINSEIAEEVELNIPKLRKKISGNRSYDEYDIQLIRYINEAIPTWNGNSIFSVEHYDEQFITAFQQLLNEVENDPNYIAHLKNMEIIENQYYRDHPEAI